MTVTPAYGRDYKTAKAARASWNGNQDWVITDLFHRYDGKPINKSQADEAKYSITLRFAQLTKTCEV